MALQKKNRIPTREDEPVPLQPPQSTLKAGRVFHNDYGRWDSAA
jgi:hypothetical protein